MVVTAATLGAEVGTQAAIAGATGAALLVANLFAGWCACLEFCGGTVAFLRQSVAPALVALPLGALAWLAARATAGHPPLVIILVTTLTVLLVFALGIRAFAPEFVVELLARLRARAAANPPCSLPKSPSLP
jgi:FtsH-binding integral membrane protein